GALPEREAHPRVFEGLLRLIAHLAQGEAMLPDLIRWETVLLADLGYGLDLTSCAVTGETAGLAFVSPKTGRAVTAAGAGIWTATHSATSIGHCRPRARCYTTASRRSPPNWSNRMPDDLIGHVEDTRLSDALSERYLAYALSTIVSRSLPDVRDGLKPVHRRLVYAMHL